jgi:AcrR family transcriptional regulator
MKRRRLNPDKRRVELIEAALKVLKKRGPVNTRVEDITKAAGAAKGTFYLYFPSWEDLLVEVRAHILSKYKSEMQKRISSEASPDWWAVFEKECVHFVNFVEELGDLHKAIFHGPIADNPINTKLSSETIIAGMLKAMVEAKVCRAIEIDTAAKLLFSILHTTADGIVQTDNRERYLNSMFDLLRAWLRVPASTIMEP